jgi:polysaccharide chain length determinant protein (PEP-CTERM system associated)
MNSGFNLMLERGKAFVFHVWKHRWLATGVAWLLGLSCMVAVPLIPERYEASARIYVDTQTVLKPLMAGLAFQPDIDQQVRMLAKTWISRPNIERLLDSPELGFKQATLERREIEISRLMEKIKVTAAGAGNLYAVAYRDTDPERARNVVNQTVQQFVASGAGSKMRDSVDASKFIDEQIKSYEAKLTEAENRLKEFKVHNVGVTGFSDQDYFGRMSALSDVVNKLSVDLRAAEQARDALRRELALEDPQLPENTAMPVAQVAPSELDVRLEAQHKQLDELLRRFTDQHPDVVSARRVIAQLERQKQLEVEAHAKTRVGAGRFGSAATSPVYQRIRVALAEAEAQVASLRSQLAAQQGQLERVRSVASKVPQVEAELAQLNRDYDIIRKNYEQLVARRESASLGLKLDESSQLAEFKVVEPPRVAPVPVFPNHTHLALLSVALMLVGALGAAQLAESLKPTLDGALDLQKMTGRPVLGTVAVAHNLASQRAEAQELRRVVAASGALLLVTLIWLGWITTRSFP